MVTDKAVGEVVCVASAPMLSKFVVTLENLLVPKSPAVVVLKKSNE